MTSGGPPASLTPAGTPPNPPLSSSLPLAGMRGLRSLLRPSGRQSRFGLAFSPAPIFLLRPLRGLLKKRGPLRGTSGLDALRGFPQPSPRQEDHGPPGFAPNSAIGLCLGEASPRPSQRPHVLRGSPRIEWAWGPTVTAGSRQARRCAVPLDIGPPGGGPTPVRGRRQHPPERRGQGLAESSGHGQPKTAATAWRSGRAADVGRSLRTETAAAPRG